MQRTLPIHMACLLTLMSIVVRHESDDNIVYYSLRYRLDVSALILPIVLLHLECDYITLQHCESRYVVCVFGLLGNIYLFCVCVEIKLWSNPR